MVKQENITINDMNLVRTYSDDGYFIIQNETNNEYAEAVDLPNRYTYRESDKKISSKP